MTRRAGTISAAGAVFAGSLVQNRARVAVCVLAIALGVALGYSVELINQSAVDELSLAVLTLSGDADLRILSAGQGFDETVYPRIARLAEVFAASPAVEVDATLEDRGDTLKIIGLDAFRAAPVQPRLIPDAGERLDILRPGLLFLSAGAAHWLDVKAGDRLNFQVGLRRVSLTVAGLLSAGAQQRFAVMDIAAAQQSFDRLGRISRIDLRLKPGVDRADFSARLRRQLPPGTDVAEPHASIQAGADVSRSYRANLNVLALVALFTGGLLVFSTQALAVGRRRAQFALLRVLGLTRGRLLALIVAEGAATGVAGGLLGVGLGYPLARLAVSFMGLGLGSGYFRAITPSLAFGGPAAGFYLLLGASAAILGSLAPGLDAVHAPPALALRAREDGRSGRFLPPAWPAVACMALGGIAAQLPALDGLPIFGYVAIALLLLGAISLMPRAAAVLLSCLNATRSVPAQLALAQLRGATKEASLSLAAIVASVSLMVAMAIMVASFRESLDSWLTAVLPADVYLRASLEGNTAYISAQHQARIAALSSVRRVEFVREQRLLLDPARPPVALLARSIAAADASTRLPLVSGPVAIAPGAPPPVWVSEAMVDLYGFVPGRVVELPIGGTRVAFTVAGVWRDYVRQQGAAVIERARYVRLTGDTNATGAAVWLAPGASVASLRGELARSVDGADRLEVSTPGEIREVSLGVFDRTFALTYALELAAVLIGLFGLSSSFAGLVLARRREFGVLRHIGMTRRQVGAMLAAEGLLLSGIGLAVGMSLGGVIGIILIDVVNRQSFHWGMHLAPPWTVLIALSLAVLALSTLTALASGRQAMGDAAVRAVKDDW